MEKPNPLEEILDDLNRKAREWPPKKFFDYVEQLVDEARRYMYTQEDAQVRENILARNREIVDFAFDCIMEQLHENEAPLLQSGGASF